MRNDNFIRRLITGKRNHINCNLYIYSFLFKHNFSFQARVASYMAAEYHLVPKSFQCGLEQATFLDELPRFLGRARVHRHLGEVEDDFVYRVGRKSSGKKLLVIKGVPQRLRNIYTLAGLMISSESTNLCYILIKQ